MSLSLSRLRIREQCHQATAVVTSRSPSLPWQRVDDGLPHPDVVGAPFPDLHQQPSEHDCRAPPREAASPRAGQGAREPRPLPSTAGPISAVDRADLRSREDVRGPWLTNDGAAHRSDVAHLDWCSDHRGGILIPPVDACADFDHEPPGGRVNAENESSDAIRIPGLALAPGAPGPATAVLGVADGLRPRAGRPRAEPPRGGRPGEGGREGDEEPAGQGACGDRDRSRPGRIGSDGTQDMPEHRRH
jgi:hypothetical protein